MAMGPVWIFHTGLSTINHESSMIIDICIDFHITYVAELSATRKIETLMITICWTEFHIKKHAYHK